MGRRQRPFIASRASRPVAPSHPGQHPGVRAEGDALHEAADEGEVEQDPRLAAVVPGGRRAPLDGHRQRGVSAAVEERRHLAPAPDPLGGAGCHRGGVGGDLGVRGEQPHEAVEIAAAGRGHEGVDDLPAGQLVLG